jgi:hypothetical protein
LLERIDEELDNIRRRQQISIEDVKEMLGSLGAEYSWHRDRVTHTRTEVTNMLLDLRLEHMEIATPEEVDNGRESISEEPDALVGSDFNIS